MFLLAIHGKTQQQCFQNVGYSLDYLHLFNFVLLYKDNCIVQPNLSLNVYFQASRADLQLTCVYNNKVLQHQLQFQCGCELQDTVCTSFQQSLQYTNNYNNQNLQNLINSFAFSLKLAVLSSNQTIYTQNIPVINNTQPTYISVSVVIVIFIFALITLIRTYVNKQKFKQQKQILKIVERKTVLTPEHTRNSTEIEETSVSRII
ncbi:Hypothetical_protein [Hexamita inflata]|uniref:Hypothetical_protein n=1 Tax=Hexamita inflata TaxID=28002 RepID=A0ABP1HGM4_9EUKA